MIVCDDYSIEQYPLQNRVVITLPPTIHTVQDTQMMPQDRRVELTRNELMAILVAVKGMYEWRGERIVEIKDGLPHLQRMTELVRCNQCKFYEGVHGVQGCAPCAFWGIGGVMWDDFCKRGERGEDDGARNI